MKALKILTLIFFASVAVGYFVNTENQTLAMIVGAPTIVEAFSKAPKIKGSEAAFLFPVVGVGYVVGRELAELDKAKNRTKAGGRHVAGFLDRQSEV